jgi:hypothetical protein
MSKSQVPKQTSTVSFSISRKDSGYYITKHIIQDGKVVSSHQATEPDVLVITISSLERLIRKAQGL